MSYLEFWCLFFSDVISGIAISAVKRCMFNVRNENKNARLLMQTYWYGIWDMTTDEQPNSIEWFLYFALILRNVFFFLRKMAFQFIKYCKYIAILEMISLWFFFCVCMCGKSRLTRAHLNLCAKYRQTQTHIWHNTENETFTTYQFKRPNTKWLMQDTHTQRKTDCERHEHEKSTAENE